ncbi:MAG: rhamnulokinase [Candidatus Aminicenantales bacterium]
MKGPCFLAFDLGAESGRAILGRLEAETIQTQEISRFANIPIRLLGHLHWNIYGLFEEITTAMHSCLADHGVRPESLAVDTWGVDFGLLAEDDYVLGLPFTYRDERTRGAMEEFLRRLPRERVYELTGIQFLPFNTLFQLFAMKQHQTSLLRCASHLLFMPDLFHFLLTGEKTSEFTIASTSQILDPRRKTWCEEILQALDLPPGLRMPDILTPGTVIGHLRPEVASSTGLEETLVIAACGHDTAAAVAAVPASDQNWAYLSSGTWSLFGVETREPVITAETLESNFTNEGGVEGTIRFLKNITGLWLIQQCRKEWSTRVSWSYEEITRMAQGAPPFQTLLDPDWTGFLNPPSMTEAIRRYCLETHQPPPLSPAQISRSILESLALKYRFTLDQLQKLTGMKIEKVHIIGGGARNELLCQFTANATGIPVVAGPAEATAVGNLMMQALALGYVGSLSEIRHIIRNSVSLQSYEPDPSADWDRAYERYLNLVLK